MTPQTLPDLSLTGGADQLTSDPNLKAVWVTIENPSGSSGVMRVGDSNVGASRGVQIEKGASFTFLRGDFDQQLYQLNAIYVHGTSGDKATITYGN